MDITAKYLNTTFDSLMILLKGNKTTRTLLNAMKSNKIDEKRMEKRDSAKSILQRRLERQTFS